MVENGQQPIAQIIVFAYDIQRFPVVHPWIARTLDDVRAMRTKHGRERSELHPTDEQFLFRIADMPAAVRIYIRDAVLRCFEHGCHFPCERIFIAEDIPRPLNGITVRSSVFDAMITPVDDVNDISHDNG